MVSLRLAGNQFLARGTRGDQPRLTHVVMEPAWQRFDDPFILPPERDTVRGQYQYSRGTLLVARTNESTIIL